MDDCDVCIIGGGPAGLSLGSELSKRFSVVVLERGDVNTGKKFWACLRKNLVDNDCAGCCLKRSKRVTVKTYLGSQVTFPADYCVVDTNRMLRIWTDELRRNGSRIINNCVFEDFSYGKEGVVVRTSRGAFTAKLLLDASGKSKIAREHGMERDASYWSCYGKKCTHVKGMATDEILYMEVLFPSTPRVYFFYYPLSRTSGEAAVYYLTKREEAKGRLAHDFERAVRTGKYARNFSSARFSEERYGTIKLNDVSRVALDRVLLVGEAGGWTPKFDGQGFNFILANHKSVARRLEGLIQSDRLGRDDLEGVFEVSDVLKTMRRYKKIAQYFFMNATDEQLNAWLENFNKLDPHIKDNFLLDEGDLRPLARIMLKQAGIFKPRDLYHLVSKGPGFVARSILGIMRDLLG